MADLTDPRTNALAQAGAVALVAALVVAAAAALGLFTAFGAHPWWAARVGWTGAGIGALLVLALHAVGVRPAGRTLLAALALAEAAWIAWTGKARFAASYAEDALAGRMWHFGWIAIAASATLLLAGLLALALAGWRGGRTQ
jgi:hypothetical protein